MGQSEVPGGGTQVSVPEHVSARPVQEQRSASSSRDTFDWDQADGQRKWPIGVGGPLSGNHRKWRSINCMMNVMYRVVTGTSTGHSGPAKLGAWKSVCALPYHNDPPGDIRVRAVERPPFIHRQRPVRSHGRLPDSAVAGSEAAHRSVWRISSRKLNRVRARLVSRLRVQMGSPMCP